MYFDAHCHLADPRIADLGGLMERAEKENVRYFIQAGVDPEDWARQKDLHKKYPQILPCFGLHPYFVARESEEACSRALRLLEKDDLAESLALGECGLDFRSEYLTQGKDHQLKFFRIQLEMAQAKSLPVVLHLVRADNEVLKILKNFAPLRGFVHAFGKNRKILESYVSLGLHISLGGAILNPQNGDLHEAVRHAPLDRLLAESDTPDQKPRDLDWPTCEPRLVPLVVGAIARLKDLEAGTVARQIWRNGETLFGRRLDHA